METFLSMLSKHELGVTLKEHVSTGEWKDGPRPREELMGNGPRQRYRRTGKQRNETPKERQQTEQFLA